MTKVLEGLATKYLDLKNKIDSLKSEQDAIKAEIKLNLKLIGKDTFIDEQERKISCKTHFRKTLDRKKLDPYLGDKLQEFMTETEITSIRITLKEHWKKK